MSVSRRTFLTGGLALAFVPMASRYAQAIGVSDVIGKTAFKWNGTLIDTWSLKRYYRANRGRGIWTSNQGLNERGKELVKVLKASGGDGLEPNKYLGHLPKNIQKLTGEELAKAELYLSQSFWRYLQDLSSGITRPGKVDPEIVVSRRKPAIEDWLTHASKRGPERVSDAMRPAHPQYDALRKKLKTAKGNMRNKIAVNMERWRWLPDSLGKRYVMVNQASFEMMIKENHKVVDRRKVIVGKPNHKTPLFSHKMEYVEFNPTWSVPDSIATREFLPKLRRDRSYLKRNGYKLYESWDEDAKEIDAKKVNWHKVSRSDFPYRIVQNPGKKNALGKVKFLFPNRFDIYLHDTPAKKLFKSKKRAYSHGCIRVHEPLEFAKKLFGERRMNQSKIDKLLAKEDTQRVDLPRPVPIHLTYFTLWIENGKVKQYEDVYGRDKLVHRLLTA